MIVLGRDRDAKPTLFVPVEVKVREFAPKLLVALTAARRGFRVYLGSKVGITAGLRARQSAGGVYFAKGGDRATVIADAARACERVVVQDEEIGPGMTPDEVRHAFATRFTAEINRHLDHVLLYSDDHLDILATIWPELADRAIVTGWPRFDLLRAGYRTRDEKLAAELRHDHGDFLLFNSRFKVTTEQQCRRRIELAQHAFEQLPAEQRTDELASDDFGSKSTERFEAFQRAIPVLEQIANHPDLPGLVIRPHPSEDPDAWERAFDGHPRVQVRTGGDVGPWILASRAVLHTASTTALQARAYGVPAGFLAEVNYPVAGAEATESYRASTPLHDIDDVRTFVRELPPRALDRPSVAPPSDEPPVATRIVDAIAELGAAPEPPLQIDPAHSLGSRVNARYKRWKRSPWSPSWLTPAFHGSNARDKLPGGLTVRDARRVLADLPRGERVTVRSLRSNLLCIELAP